MIFKLRAIYKINYQNLLILILNIDIDKNWI